MDTTQQCGETEISVSDGVKLDFLKCANFLREWQALVSASSQSLSALETYVPQLQKRPEVDMQLLKGLFVQAPSNWLGSLIQNGGKLTSTLPADIIQNIDHSYNTAKNASLQATDISQQFADVVGHASTLRLQPTSIHPTQGTQDMASEVTADVAELSCEAQSAQGDSVGWEPTGMSTANSETRALGDDHEDLLLILMSLSHSLQQQSEMMAKVAAALTLECPEEELRTYATMWRLQPYIDDDVLESALALAESLQAQTSKG